MIDECGLMGPRGTFAVEASGTFSFTVPLEASRRKSDRDGRLYTIHVTVRDLYGNTADTTVSIVVPHDKRRQGHGAPGRLSQRVDCLAR